MKEYIFLGGVLVIAGALVWALIQDYRIAHPHK